MDSEKEKSPPLIPPLGETGFGPELQSAFEAWLAYKEEKRQAYKPTGLKSLVGSIRKNAERYGEQEVADLIRECMASNWQGIIFDRLARTKGTAPKNSRDAVKTAADYDGGDDFV